MGSGHKFTTCFSFSFHNSFEDSLLRNMMPAFGPILLMLVSFITRSSSTEQFPVTAISEVEFKGGAAHATSFYDHNWTADKAFILGQRLGWHDNPNAYGIFPKLIWYEFPAGKTFAPARISFRKRKDCCPGQGPTMWQYVA